MKLLGTTENKLTKDKDAENVLNLEIQSTIRSRRQNKFNNGD